jgi:hypothetical protein
VRKQPDGQPVRYRSRCHGRQYCSLNSPPGGSSSRHRGLEQRYCLPPDANMPSLRSQCPVRSRSCPATQSVTRRLPPRSSTSDGSPCLASPPLSCRPARAASHARHRRRAAACPSRAGAGSASAPWPRLAARHPPGPGGRRAAPKLHGRGARPGRRGPARPAPGRSSAPSRWLARRRARRCAGRPAGTPAAAGPAPRCCPSAGLA